MRRAKIEVLRVRYNGVGGRLRGVVGIFLEIWILTFVKKKIRDVKKC